MSDDRLKEIVCTAYHEAGHAVLGWLVGHKIGSVRLYDESNRESRGATYFRQAYPSRRYISAVYRTRRTCPDVTVAIDIVVLFAGYLAERLLDPHSDPKQDWGHLDDEDKVASLLNECGQGDNAPLWQSLAAVCVNYLVEHWPHVEALAEALLRDGRIVKSKDIRKILGKRTLPLRKVVKKIASAWNAGLAPA